MPCYYDDFGESERLQRAALDRATRLLCQATARLEDNGLLTKGTDLFKWSEEHKEMDRKRKEREKADKARKLKDAKDALARATSVLNRLNRGKLK